MNNATGAQPKGVFGDNAEVALEGLCEGRARYFQGKARYGAEAAETQTRAPHRRW